MGQSCFSLVGLMVIALSGCCERVVDVSWVPPQAVTTTPETGKDALEGLLKASWSDIPPFQLTGVEAFPLTRVDPLRPVVFPTYAALDEFVAYIATADVVDDQPMLYAHVRNDCEKRAHIAYAVMQKKHPDWAAGKLFIHTNHLDLGLEPMVFWGYHVAPVVLAKNASGKIELAVIDPAFNNERAIPAREWFVASLNMRKTRDPKNAIPIEINIVPGTEVTNQFGQKLHYELSTPEQTENQLKESVAYTLNKLIDLRDTYGDNANIRHRNALIVSNIDLTENRVWFTNVESKDETKYFFFNGSQKEKLEASFKYKKSIKISYFRVPSCTRPVFKWFWRGSFLNINAVEFE